MSLVGAPVPPVRAGVSDSSSRGLGAKVRPSTRLRKGVLLILTTPGGLIGTVIVVGLIVLAIFGPQLAPYSFTQIDVNNPLQGSTLHHLLGTDQLGRDLLSRLIDGTRIELEVAVPAVATALSVGLVLGLLGGYLGGVVDNVVVLFMDTCQSFPAIVLALVLLTVVGPSLPNLIIVIAVTFSPNYARTSRALVLSVKQNQYIVAERARRGPITDHGSPRAPQHCRPTLHPPRHGHPERHHDRSGPLLSWHRRAPTRPLLGIDPLGRIQLDLPGSMGRHLRLDGPRYSNYRFSPVR